MKTIKLTDEQYNSLTRIVEKSMRVSRRYMMNCQEAIENGVGVQDVLERHKKNLDEKSKIYRVLVNNHTDDKGE